MSAFFDWFAPVGFGVVGVWICGLLFVAAVLCLLEFWND